LCQSQNSSAVDRFIRIPELTWKHFDDSADVVYVGQQIDEPLALDPLL
jgi:hypothetical protein